MSESEYGAGAVPSTRMVYGVEPDVEQIVRATAALAAGPVDTVSVTCVLGRTPPERWQWAWEQFVDWAPANLDVAQLVAGTHNPTLGDGSGSSTEGGRSPITSHEHTINHADLTGIGQFVVDSIGNWRDRAAEEGDEFLLCIDSVEGFLAYETREAVFKFLHLVGSRVSKAGGRLVCVLDSDAVDDATRIVFQSVFDDVVAIPDRRTGD